jgi:hypothetical protein
MLENGAGRPARGRTQWLMRPVLRPAVNAAWARQVGVADLKRHVTSKRHMPYMT